jgi:hypothetical protein
VARTAALKVIAPTLAAAVEDGASAAAEADSSSDAEDEVIVQFYDAYQCRNNRNGTLQSRIFAFGDNPGIGPAPPHMRQHAFALSDVYERTSTGTAPDFIEQDPTAPMTNQIQIPAELSAVTVRPRSGTLVYVFFPAELGRTYTWRAGFYCGAVV